MFKILMISAAIVLGVLDSQATVIPALQQQVEEQLLAFEPYEASVLAPEGEDEAGSALTAAGNEKWILKTFGLRARAKAGFEISGFTKFQVIPEIEMLWQKPNPSGWDNYKP